MSDEPTVTRFEVFKWNTLGHAVFEDYQGLQEPLAWLRGGGVIEGQSEVAVTFAVLEIGDARGSLQVAERGLAVDALDEDMWRLALEAEGELGLREALEARYGRLQEILDARLGLEPAKERAPFTFGC